MQGHDFTWQTSSSPKSLFFMFSCLIQSKISINQPFSIHSILLVLKRSFEELIFVRQLRDIRHDVQFWSWHELYDQYVLDFSIDFKSHLPW